MKRGTVALLLVLMVVASVARMSVADGPVAGVAGARRLQDSTIPGDSTSDTGTAATSGTTSGTDTSSGTTPGDDTAPGTPPDSGSTGTTTTTTDPTSGTTSGTDPGTGTTSTDPGTGTTSTDPTSGTSTDPTSGTASGGVSTSGSAATSTDPSSGPSSHSSSVATSDPSSGTTSGTNPGTGTTSTDPTSGTASDGASASGSAVTSTDPSSKSSSHSSSHSSDFPSGSTSGSDSSSGGTSTPDSGSSSNTASGSSDSGSGSTTTTPTPNPSTTVTTAPRTTTPSAPSTASPSTATPAPQTSSSPSTSTPAPQATSSPATSTPKATTGTSVVHYNSSTLPPSIDESELNGAKLVRVEVTKTTNPDGTTTYSYVVVSQLDGKMQTYNETSKVATDVISSSSSSSGGALANGGQSSSKSSGLSSGALIGIVVGGLVFMVLLIGFFVLRRRQTRQSDDSDQDVDDDVIMSPVPTDYANRPRGLSAKSGNYKEMTPTTATTRSSSDSAPNRSRRSGSDWEDPVIVAARVPFDRVTIGELLGKGAYGEVYRGEFRDQAVAVKKLTPDTKKSMKHITDFLAEIRLLASMDHPRIVAFVGVAWDALTDLMCLTEFMAGGDLRSLLIDYHEAHHPVGFDAEKATIALHVAHGLTYLHSLNPIVLHRDLKSRNILLTATLEAKLTDFGVSRERSDRTMTAGVGSYLWMAPEVMKGMRYDEKADVFSLGVVLSELDTHELPYSHAKDSHTGGPMMDMAILQQVSAGRLRVGLSDRILPSLHYLIMACVSLDPRQRPTAAQALYELQVLSRSLK